jgi:uncharacterized protein (TIGR02646 family)
VIHVDPIEPAGDEWQAWRARADAATSLLETDPPPAEVQIDADLYKGGRDAILRLFHGKCAYCESQLTADQHKGDVDHFRPKKRVTDEHGNPIDHPGYFWLAYKWTNLLPACAACNRPGTDLDGSKGGKWDKFPVGGQRAKRFNDPLPPEDPWLIDPYHDDPAEHLIFDHITGFIAGKTPKGQRTIDILNLNREDLAAMRKRFAKSAGDDYREYIAALLRCDAEEAAERKQACSGFQSGEAPYSAFGREAIRQMRERLTGEL